MDKNLFNTSVIRLDVKTHHLNDGIMIVMKMAIGLIYSL